MEGRKMTRGDIREIKKSISNPKSCSINKMYGCYVNGTKEIVTRWQQRILSLTEEEYFKYLKLFGQCFSGALHKTMFEVIPDSEKREELINLREGLNANVRAEEALDQLYYRIIEQYEYVGNYLILVATGAYDIPGKTTDGATMEDASDEVYEYAMVCICPVSLSKPGLGYDVEKECFTNVDRDWIVGAPEVACLYPAFNDRSQDLDKALVYAKSITEEENEFIQTMLGCQMRQLPKKEQSGFESMLESVLGSQKNVKEVFAVNQAIQNLIIDRELDGSDLIGVEEIREALVAAGVDEKRLELLESTYALELGRGEKISLNSIVRNNKYTIRTDRGTLTLPQYAAEEADIKLIGGEPHLVLRLAKNQNITVNNIDVYIQ